MKALLRHVASIWLCLWPVSLHAENTFEVAGLWNTISHAHDSGHLQTNHRPFFVAVNGQDMFIRVNSGNRDEGIAYHEYGISAGTAYEFVRFQNSSGKVQNDATLAIMAVPKPRATASARIWQIYSLHPELTEGSEDYLEPLNLFSLNTRITNMSHRSFILENLTLRTEWARSEAKPHFLRHVVQYADGRLSRRPRSNWDIPDELKTGRTNTLLTILSWTNVAGLSIPSLATMIRYRPDTSRPDGPLVVQWQETVILTNASLGTTHTNFVPQITARTRVLDRRASTDTTQPIEYISTNAIVIEDPIEAYAEKERQESERARARAERRAREAQSGKENDRALPGERKTAPSKAKE